MNATGAAARANEEGAVLGDFRALGRVLGSAGGRVGDAVTLPARFGLGAEGLREFVHRYRREVLLPLELPLIREAHAIASRREARELVHLDASFSGEHLSPEISSASRRVGGVHLQAMQPMRDERIVRRYWAEVKAGRAHGWHTVVYGLFLALHSLPLRQGLLNYARQTQAGFILSAAARGKVSETESLSMIDEFDAGLPEFLREFLGIGGHPALALV